MRFKFMVAFATSRCICITMFLASFPQFILGEMLYNIWCIHFLFFKSSCQLMTRHQFFYPNGLAEKDQTRERILIGTFTNMILNEKK